MFSYLPKSVQTIGFILFIFMSSSFVWYRRNLIQSCFLIDEETRKLKIYFRMFLNVSIFYFFFSFFNIPKIWNIQGLAYNMSYLPRHFFIIAELFIPILLSYGIYRLKPYNRFKLSVLIPFYLFVFIVNIINDEICVMGMLLITLTLIAWKLHSKFVMLFAFFINYGQSAYVLAFLFLIFLLSFEKRIITFLYKNTISKIIVMSLVSIIGIFLASGILMFYIEEDANSLWRLNVWINEIASLSQTYFSGVGFGSAYVTDDIMFQVDNSTMYTNNDDNSLDTGAFLVANHSSILNMFYRMGLIGGVLFLVLNIQLVRIVIKTYQYANVEMRSLLWRLFSVFIYETIIISLNPGLEMMQFALSYILSLSMLLAVIYEIQNHSILCKTPNEY